MYDKGDASDYVKQKFVSPGIGFTKTKRPNDGGYSRMRSTNWMSTYDRTTKWTGDNTAILLKVTYTIRMQL